MRTPLLALLLIASISAHAQISLIRQQIASTHKALKSASATIHQTTTIERGYDLAEKGVQNKPRTQTANITWAFKGDKYIETTVDPNSERHDSHTFLSDGKYEWFVLQQNNGKGRTMAQRSAAIHGFASPIFHSYMINGKWAETLLTNDRYSIDGEEQDPKFGTLTVLRSNIGEPATLWISMNMGGMIVKTDLLSMSGIPLRIVDSVTSVALVDGVYLPTSIRSEWTTQHLNEWIPYMTTVETMENVSANTVADSIFRLPKLKEGDDVRDADRTKMYKVGKNGKLPRIG